MSEIQYDPDKFRLENEPEMEMERLNVFEFRITVARHGRRSKTQESLSKAVVRAMELALGGRAGSAFGIHIVQLEEVPPSE